MTRPLTVATAPSLISLCISQSWLMNYDHSNLPAQEFIKNLLLLQSAEGKWSADFIGDLFYS